jgi:hypothetical protein
VHKEYVLQGRRRFVVNKNVSLFEAWRHLTDVILAKGDEDAKKVANVMTAMRGIDGEVEVRIFDGAYYTTAKQLRKAIKRATSGIIRAVAFPMTAISEEGRDTTQWVMTLGATKIQASHLAQVDRHFARHIVQAAGALGIEIIGEAFNGEEEETPSASAA